MFWSPKQALVVQFSRQISIKPTIERSVIIKVEKNLIVLPSLRSDDMYVETIEFSGKSHIGGTDQRSCLFWAAESLTKNYCQKNVADLLVPAC